MNQNSELIKTYRMALAKSKGRTRDELLEAKHGYEIACVLSNGPDPDRCEHWERQAVEAEKRLAVLAQRMLRGEKAGT